MWRGSFEIPEYTGYVTGLGRSHLGRSEKRAYNPFFIPTSSSEIFGMAREPLKKKPPLSIHAVPTGSQSLCLLDHRPITGSYNCMPGNGILFNHESPRPRETFVVAQNSRVCAHQGGPEKHLYLGNWTPSANWLAHKCGKRCCLHASQDDPQDYFIVPANSTVKEFVEPFRACRL